MQIFLYCLAGIGTLLALLFAVIMIRTLSFKPKAQPIPLEGEEKVDRDRITKNLQELIRCKTVSYRDPSLEDDAEFEKLISLLPTLYPNVYKTCTLIRPHKRALLYRWRGKKEDAPTVMMAHYDVVPVNEEAWEKPPFEAILEDGVIWGRGTLDTKGTFASILYAADSLIAEGFVPALNASTVGIMVPVGMVFTVIVARILYKRGVL
jgi:carboxypeptidase PM20D1